MDINHYLNLLIEQNGECLSLKSGSLPKIKLNGEDKLIGKTELNSANTKSIAFSLLDEIQKRQLVQEESITFTYSSMNRMFTIKIEAKHTGLNLFISPNQIVANANPTQKEIQVLGKMHEKNLPLLLYLTEMIKLGASELFLSAGCSVKIKLLGEFIVLDAFILTPELTKSCAYSIMTFSLIEEFEKTKNVDFAFVMPNGSARFRVNVFFQRKTVGLVIRLIPSTVPTTQELNLPDILLDLIMAERGLLLIVGGIGSGKSTTLAAMINYRNSHSAGHILTIEDSIEFSHPNLKSIVNQREIGMDTHSYASALKASLNQAPDVIFIGEIRDKHTMESALEHSNSGRLCISTLPANDVNQAMEQIINMFPYIQHKQLLMQLSANLLSVISQRLIPDIRGKRCVAMEIMLNTPHIANLILKGELNELKTAIISSANKGMKTFDESLYELYTSGHISLEEALKNSNSRNDLETKINFG